MDGLLFIWRAIISYFEIFGYKGLLIIIAAIVLYKFKTEPDFSFFKKGYVREKINSQKRIDKERKLITKQTIGYSPSLETSTQYGLPFLYTRNNVGDKMYAYVFWEANPPHVIFVGGSGRGKTVEVISQLNVIDDYCGFCFDIAGDISKNLINDNVLIYEPASKNIKFNFFELVDKERDEGNYDYAFMELEDLIKMMFPTNRFITDSSSKYYLETGQDIFKSAFYAFYPIGWDFIPICKKIATIGTVEEMEEQITKAYQFVKQKYGIDHPYVKWEEKALELIRAIYKQNEKNTSGAFGEAKKIAQKYDHYPLLTEENVGRGERSIGISIINSKFLVLKVAKNDIQRYSAVTELITAQSLTSVKTRSIGQLPRQIILLDEFASLLNNNKDLVEFIVRGSETFRKYNSKLIMIVQSISSLREKMGNSQNNLNALVTNVGSILLLSVTIPEEARWLADFVGKKWVKKIGGSSSNNNETSNYNFVEEYELSAEEIRSIPYNQCILIYQGGFIKGYRLIYYEESDITKRLNIDESAEVIELEIVYNFDDVFVQDTHNK